MGKKLVLPALVCVWGLFVGAGFLALWSYGGTPGSGENAPEFWPKASNLVQKGGPTLVVFAHPLCPCTHATLTELENLLAVSGDRLETHVVFIAPVDADTSWQDSELWAQARGLKGVSCHADEGRYETTLFGARTSGTCLLYATDGRLLFRGGLTAARGESGASDGRRALARLALGLDSPVSATSSFGCPLFEPSAACQSACKQ